MKQAPGLVCLFLACGPLNPATVDSGVEVSEDAGAGLALNPWADRVVRFAPGPGAGFGQDIFPDVVLGAPTGGGEHQGSLDVLALGKSGVIELEMTDVAVIDGPGVDLLVFENGFSGYFENAVVAVSEDGIDWKEFPCAADAGVKTGCAGLNPVFANPAQGISATDPHVSGGDGFDLVDVGLSRARFVRVTDTGTNRFYGPPGGGFDLDAIAVVNGLPLNESEQ